MERKNTVQSLFCSQYPGPINVGRFDESLWSNMFVRVYRNFPLLFSYEMQRHVFQEPFFGRETFCKTFTFLFMVIFGNLELSMNVEGRRVFKHTN